MHEVEAKTILTNGKMDVYKGCSHGCVYCDSISKSYKTHHEFTDIEVKINAPKLLNDKISKMKAKTVIGIGVLSDPYVDIEADYKLTRQCLEVIYKNGFGVSLVTKSDMVLRDLDLLTKINKETKAVVGMTLTCAYDELSTKIETNVCPTSKRIEALKKCKEAGLYTVAWLTPFLPYVNDTEENFRKLLELCKEANVDAIVYYGCGMTLREGTREHYYQFLDKNYPFMKRKYGLEFKNGPVASRFAMDKVYQILLDEFCTKNDIMYDLDDIQHFTDSFESKATQLSIFDEGVKEEK